MPQLSDVPAVQGAPGHEGEDVSSGGHRRRGAGQLVPHAGRAPAQLPERSVLRRPKGGQPSREPERRGIGLRLPGRIGRTVPRHSLADREDGQRGTFGVLQHEMIGVGRHGPGWDVERHGNRPGGAGGSVGQRASFGHGGHVGGGHEAVQRSERPRRDQLEVAELGLV